MCGIAGILIFEGEDELYGDRTEKLVRAMAERLSHRGPDGEGFWSDPSSGIYLGHRRLAIVDLSESASQPMVNDDESIAIVYNGEVYNASELRAELESTGKYRWKTDHCDTEVILRAYEEWGEACLERLRGMFAFAIWDGRTKRLWLVRDRIGIKPLYYSLDGKRIVFASEIKALLEDPRLEKDIDVEALYHYLTFYVSPPPNTLFKNVKKLEPGCSLRIGIDGTMVHRRWWDLSTASQPRKAVSFQQYKEIVRSALEESVTIHKISDVPVGVFLSGGLDSSINAVLFAKEELKPVRTFSLGYVGSFESYKNEYEHARLIASAVEARHYEVDMSVLDFAGFLPRMAEHLEEPLGDPVAVSIYFLSALAKNEGVTVCQLGEGSDELFGGYRSWQVLIAAQRYGGWLPSSVLGYASRLAEMVAKSDSRPALWLERMSQKIPPFFGGAEGFSDKEKSALLAGEALKAAKGLSSWEVVEPYWKKFTEHSPLLSPLQWMSYLDLSFRVPELLLMRVDKMSMAASLEARVPFLDHKVVEKVMGIPESVRMKHLERKHLLKEAMQDQLPPLIYQRKKQGFRVPIAEWLEMPTFVAFAKDVISRFSEETGLLAPSAIKTVLDNSDKRRLWLLVVVALWWHTYFGSENVDMTKWFPSLGKG